MFTTLIQNLKEKALTKVDDYIDYYVDIEYDLINELRDGQLLKSDVFITDVNEAIRYLNFSMLFSDFSSLYTMALEDEEYRIKNLEPGHPKFWKTIQLPKSIGEQVEKHKNPIFNGYLYWPQNLTGSFIRKVEPYIDQNRAVLRPSRTIMIKDQLGIWGVDWKGYYIDPNSDSGNWVYHEDQNDSIPILFQDSNINFEPLFEIVVPFLENVPVSTIAEILAEEEDLLRQFRVSIRELVDQAMKSGFSVQEIIRDKINPQINKIGKRFNLAKKSHKLRVGAAIGTYILSLIAVPGFVPANVMAAIVGGGMGVLGVSGSEIKYHKDVEEIKEDPFYLIWMLRKG